MQSFDADQLGKLDDRFRKNLINSLMGARPAILVGTSNAKRQFNLAIFSQVLHVGANPPLCGILFRPDSVKRHTLENIRETGVFTMNVISTEFADKVHQTSARYSEEQSEFEAVGLKAEMLDSFAAPAVKEAHIKACVALEEELPLSTNGTILIVGAVQKIMLNEKGLRSDGSVDHFSMNSLSVCGLDDYAAIQPVSRYSYAKPDKWPNRLSE
jgi:flavin reductase (DIM6/NTAB) family NADH-FMN oxidoreductase RutF